jgi:DNA-binding NarL/FixJ family response regulator
MKVLVVDDHVLIREALRGVLRELEREIEILEADDCEGARVLIEQHLDFELMFLDLCLPDGNGLALLKTIRSTNPAVGVIVLSASRESEIVIDALRLGAVGFVPKSSARPVILSAIKLILAGGIYVPPDILKALDSARVADTAGTSAEKTKAISPLELGLTERQIDVLALMMQGKSNKAICRELNIAEATVKTHGTTIFKVLKATNRTEAVIAASGLGWTPDAMRR